MRIRTQSFYCALFIFIFSCVIFNFYTDGDQVAYSNAYEIVQGVSIYEASILYGLHVSSADFIHFILIWLASNGGLNKIFFTSFLNGMLAYISFNLFVLWGAECRVAASIVLLNFYMFVLYFAAERLKIGIFFLFLSFLYSKKYWIGVLYFFLGLISHVSILIIGMAFWIQNTMKLMSKKNIKFLNLIIYVIILCSIIFYIFHADGGVFLRKLNFYISNHNEIKILDFIPTLMCIYFSCAYCKKIVNVFIFFAPILIGVYFFGPERLNFFSYFLFLYFGLRFNRGMNLGVIASNFYLFLKSILFIFYTISYGQGFIKI